VALNWLRQTTYTVVATRARAFPGHVALILVDAEGGKPHAVTYADLHAGIDETARRLWGAGVRDGTRLGLWAENSRAWLETWLAGSLIGAVTVAINPRLTPREVSGLLAATGVTHLLAGGRTIAGTAELAGEAGGAPKDVYAIDGSAELPALPAAVAPSVAAPIDGQRIGLIQFTSGSSGMPKGVQLREGAVATVGACCASRWLLHPGDRLLGVFSLAHNAGSTFTTMSAFTAGAALVLPAGGWAAGQGAEVAARTGVTVLPGLDTIVTDLFASGIRPPSLRAVVGGFDAGTSRRLAGELGVEVASTYGLSETTAAVSTGDLRDPPSVRIERIGLPHPGLAVRIVNEQGGEVNAGSSGEIQVRGWSVMAGYDGVASEEQPFTRDGWVRTGDLGMVDDRGYMAFLGRLKDVIRSGGENVSTFEIERFLESHPAVLQAAVVPAPHPRFGEVPFAFVRLRPDASADGSALIDFCRGQLASFKIPKRVEIVERFPLVGIDKVSKPDLRRQAAALAHDAPAGEGR
jgi:acyl-CoA synthetase (AMP-forming)/AMP-acid ligase II